MGVRKNVKKWPLILVLVGSGVAVFLVLSLLKWYLNSNFPIKVNNETNRPEINSLPKFEVAKKQIIKIKKTADQLYCYKSEWETKNGGGSSEITLSEKNLSAILQEDYEKKGWKKEVLISWKSELKDNLWLVKKKEGITGRPGHFFYSGHYENDGRE